jgi:hypothetical protein
MSETTEIQPLHVGAFAAAMVGGPLIVTLCSFWILLIPVFALVIGGIPYIVIGTPMALWMALTGPVTFERGARWGGLTILFITAGAILLAVITAQTEAVSAILIVGCVSTLFAMLWAGTTGGIYRAMTKPRNP